MDLVECHEAVQRAEQNASLSDLHSSAAAAEILKENSPGAINSLGSNQKIEMMRQLNKLYRLDHAVNKTQKVIVSAYNINARYVKYKVNYISKI